MKRPFDDSDQHNQSPLKRSERSPNLKGLEEEAIKAEMDLSELKNLSLGRTSEQPSHKIIRLSEGNSALHIKKFSTTQKTDADHAR